MESSSLMLAVDSPIERAKYLRQDAYIALGTSGLAVLVLGLHASGRSRTAYGLAMGGAIVTGVVTFARMLSAANRLERSAYPGSV